MMRTRYAQNHRLSAGFDRSSTYTGVTETDIAWVVHSYIVAILPCGRIAARRRRSIGAAATCAKKRGGPTWPPLFLLAGVELHQGKRLRSIALWQEARDQCADEYKGSADEQDIHLVSKFHESPPVASRAGRPRVHKSLARHRKSSTQIGLCIAHAVRRSATAGLGARLKPRNCHANFMIALQQKNILAVEKNAAGNAG